MTLPCRFVGLPALAILAIAAVPALAQTPPQTASEFYVAYRIAFDKATTIDELMAFMAKETRAKVEATPAGERGKMFEFLKMVGTVTDMKILREAKSATGATLTVEALDPDKKKTSGTIHIVREGGAWKLGNESWSSSS
jgi:hypothetical protein